jgi:hypothetical protein
MTTTRAAAENVARGPDRRWHNRGRGLLLPEQRDGFDRRAGEVSRWRRRATKASFAQAFARRGRRASVGAIWILEWSKQ